jgi:hypothetical protein
LPSFNPYHYALAGIGGLILAIWTEGRRLERGGYMSPFREALARTLSASM